ncbi:tetratricopeptide repeat protein [Neolewinella lacunae]|uniref:Tetratricopeptide repeat protein n=1 Tax=Neolewinella lacunae TaxID=1517758 RepID=A0A923PPJ0_9BACT|nr:tetratricopeptide repeat protein [Neolewinella lacunae]MBC6996501.1 tetratricopeptide repeat protein [Neolewinella lacunae]MDN3636654.1 tetratricopeptide repeat protein [Neolewinella lacunae]
MRSLIAALSFLLFFTACGGNSGSGDATASAQTDVFADAAAALAADEGAGRVARLLADNFSRLSDPATGALNMAASEQYVGLAEALAGKYPGDTLAALPLYRAAEVVRAMGNSERTAQIYARVHQEYPNFSKAPEALFMLAFTYDEELRDLDRAKATYQLFLERYPNNDFADDATMLIENLGKSDEEVLRELEAKSKEIQ